MVFVRQQPGIVHPAETVGESELDSMISAGGRRNSRNSVCVLSLPLKEEHNPSGES